MCRRIGDRRFVRSRSRQATRLSFPAPRIRAVGGVRVHESAAVPVDVRPDRRCRSEVLMKSIWRGFVAMVVAACAAAQEPVEAVAPADPVDVARAQVDAARTAWEDEVRRAREELLKAVDAALQGLEKNRRLSDVERVKRKDRLSADRAMIQRGGMPHSQQLESPAAIFLRTEVKARQQFRAKVRASAARIRTRALEVADAMIRDLEAECPFGPSPEVFVARLAKLAKSMDDHVIKKAANPDAIVVKDRLRALVNDAAASRVTVAELRHAIESLLEKVRESHPFRSAEAKHHALIHEVAQALAGVLVESGRKS